MPADRIVRVDDQVYRELTRRKRRLEDVPHKGRVRFNDVIKELLDGKKNRKRKAA